MVTKRGVSMNENYRKIGYIRTNCFNKIAELIRNLELTALKVERSEQEETDEIKPCGYIVIKGTQRARLRMDWDWKRHGVPWGSAYKQLLELKNKYGLADFVIEKMQIGLDDSKLVDLINREIKYWEEGQGLVKKSPELKSDVRIYINFANTPLAYTTLNGWDSDIIRDINLEELQNLGFKKGVLDMVHITTDRKIIYGETENLNILIQNADIIKQIMKHFNTDVWYQLPGIRKIEREKGKAPTPCAIRTYEMQKGEKFVFIRDEEIR